MTGLNFDLKVEGVEELARRFAGGDKTIERETHKALGESGVVVRDTARSHSPGYVLRPSIRYEFKNPLEVDVGSVAKTVASIEGGRKPGEQPSFENIFAWMNRYGIVSESAARAGATQKVAATKGGTHRVNRRPRTAAAAQLQAARTLAIIIGRRGTKPLPFLRPAWEGGAPKVKRLFQEAMDRAMVKLLRG